MKNIEQNELFAAYERFVAEAVEEHAAMVTYCEVGCRACRKRAIAIELEAVLGIVHDRPDVALD